MSSVSYMRTWHKEKGHEYLRYQCSCAAREFQQLVYVLYQLYLNIVCAIRRLCPRDTSAKPMEIAETYSNTDSRTQLHVPQSAMRLEHSSKAHLEKLAQACDDAARRKPIRVSVSPCS